MGGGLDHGGYLSPIHVRESGEGHASGRQHECHAGTSEGPAIGNIGDECELLGWLAMVARRQFAMPLSPSYKPPVQTARDHSRPGRRMHMPTSVSSGRAIVTIIGLDRVGIIAAVTGALAEANVNILDISQSVLREEVFTMIMMVDLAKARVPYEELSTRLKDIGRDLKVQVEVQREDIFKAMHRI
jgi:ACT domain-containing protein